MSVVNFNVRFICYLTLPRRRYTVVAPYTPQHSFPEEIIEPYAITIHDITTTTTTTHDIHPGYARLLSSLIADIGHGGRNRHWGVRCGMKYAERILDHFSAELIQSQVTNGLIWRSSVLNPILQRQFHGYSDGDGHMFPRHFPCAGKAELDYLMKLDYRVDEFYLKADPLAPQEQPVLRRNILYITEARWFLGKDKAKEGNAFYAACGERTNTLWRQLCKQQPESSELQGFEVDIIVEERLEQHFRGDCRRAVSSYMVVDKVSSPLIAFPRSSKITSNGRFRDGTSD